MSNTKVKCDRCKSELDLNVDFCQNCGILFNEKQKCVNHTEKSATGACVICGKTYCSNCGSNVDELFLCFEHEHFEIIQGMVRVFGTSDVIQVEYAKECLEQEELHPFVFSKKASPLHLGGSDYSLFRAAGNSPGNPINEIKLMLPFNEVLSAIKVLTDLEIITG